MPCTPDIEVFLGDTMGEVPFFYAACNVAFVGGTLVPVGGHNLLEPAAVGKPVITGPYLYNPQDIADKFQKHGASITVNNPLELGTAVENLFANPERAADIGNRGRQIVRHNRGALDRLLRLLEPLSIGLSVSLSRLLIGNHFFRWAAFDEMPVNLFEILHT